MGLYNIIAMHLLSEYQRSGGKVLFMALEGGYVKDSMSCYLQQLAENEKIHQKLMSGSKAYFIGFDECSSIKNAEKQKQNNDWRKSSKRGFNGYWSAK